MCMRASKRRVPGLHMSRNCLSRRLLADCYIFTDKFPVSCRDESEQNDALLFMQGQPLSL